MALAFDHSGFAHSASSWSWREHKTIEACEISSWKLKKSHDGGATFAVYCINVIMRSGLRWVIEKRYQQFRILRRQLKDECKDIMSGEVMASIEFPSKQYFFNLHEKMLTKRQEMLTNFLCGLVNVDPQPVPLHNFLQVTNNVSLSLSRHSTDAGSGLRFRNAALRSISRCSISSVHGIEAGSSPSVSDFHVLRVIGKGSFGKVYLVRPTLATNLGEVYAMKVLKKSDVIRRHQVEHTKTERRILAAISHPFLLSLRFAFQTSDKLYMLTDYCPGGELFFHLKKMQCFPEPMVQFYASQIALAVEYLHNRGIVYRDLKPENLLLDRDGNCKLTDFGLSKIIDQNKLGESICDCKTGSAAQNGHGALTFCGTPEYLSPEMLIHRQRGTGYSYEIDLWALGVVIFELLTGWPPFFDRDFARMCDKILTRPLRFPVDKKKHRLSPSAQKFISGLLIREPTRRLGCGERGQRDIRYHAFFNGIDWDTMERGCAMPPYVPHAEDSRNFDKELAKLPVAESPPVSSRLSGFIMHKGRSAFEAKDDSNIVIPPLLFEGFDFALSSQDIFDDEASVGVEGGLVLPTT